MKKSYLQESDYIEFLNSANYNAGKSVQNENKKYFKLSPKKFCEAQLEKFERSGNKTGCCLNFSAYLLKKYHGFILTCKDNGGIHCAFVYKVKGRDDLYVCDPAKEKIVSMLFGGEVGNGVDCSFFGIPLSLYEFENCENGKRCEQEYSIRLGFDSEDSDGSFVNKLLNGETITVKRLKDLDLDEVYARINAKQKTGE